MNWLEKPLSLPWHRLLFNSCTELYAPNNAQQKVILDVNVIRIQIIWLALQILQPSQNGEI